MNKAETPLRESYPIRRRKILKRSFVNFIKAFVGSCVVFGLIFGLIWVSCGSDEDKFISGVLKLRDPLLAVTALLVLWMFWYPIYQYLYYSSYYYDINEKNLYIRKGVTSKREITIPLSKITDVYLDQDMVDIMLGLYDLHVSTPTAESLKFAHISGLNREGATKIKALIFKHIHKESNSEMEEGLETVPDKKTKS
jgi:uncharacterized membrane protein YdbT with pleckstrin-like domain